MSQTTPCPPSKQMFSTCYTRTPPQKPKRPLTHQANKYSQHAIPEHLRKTTDPLSTKKATNLKVLYQNTSGRAPDDPMATKQACIHKRQVKQATIYKMQYQCTSGGIPTDPDQPSKQIFIKYITITPSEKHQPTHLAYQTSNYLHNVMP